MTHAGAEQRTNGAIFIKPKYNKNNARKLSQLNVSNNYGADVDDVITVSGQLTSRIPRT